MLAGIQDYKKLGKIRDFFQSILQLKNMKVHRKLTFCIGPQLEEDPSYVLYILSSIVPLQQLFFLFLSLASLLLVLLLAP